MKTLRIEELDGERVKQRVKNHIDYLTSDPEYIVDRYRARRIESKLRRLIGIAIRDQETAIRGQIFEYEINR